MVYTHVKIRKSVKFVVDIEVNKHLVCFCYTTNYQDDTLIKASMFGLNTIYPEVYLQAMSNSFPDYNFNLVFNIREYYLFYEMLKGVFYSVYGVYVDRSTKLWGIGSEEQDSFMEVVLQSMFPYLPEGSYNRVLSLQPATYSSLINLITNYSQIRN